MISGHILSRRLPYFRCMHVYVSISNRYSDNLNFILPDHINCKVREQTRSEHNHVNSKMEIVIYRKWRVYFLHCL